MSVHFEPRIISMSGKNHLSMYISMYLIIFGGGPCCSFSFLLFLFCCPIMCLYVLSSVLWYPLRFPHKNDALSVFISSCLIYVICVCLRRVMFNAYSVVFLFRFLRLVYPTGARGTNHPLFLTFCLQIYFQ